MKCCAAGFKYRIYLFADVEVVDVLQWLS